jgi:hypothetical protein
MLKLECPDCGPVDHLLFDASVIRERDFEGVFFRVDLTNKGVVISGLPDNAGYLSDFNTKKLFKEAKQMVEEEQFEYIYCPKCKESLE